MPEIIETRTEYQVQRMTNPQVGWFGIDPCQAWFPPEERWYDDEAYAAEEARLVRSQVPAGDGVRVVRRTITTEVTEL